MTKKIGLLFFAGSLLILGISFQVGFDRDKDSVQIAIENSATAIDSVESNLEPTNPQREFDLSKYMIFVKTSRENFLIAIESSDLARYESEKQEWKKFESKSLAEIENQTKDKDQAKAKLTQARSLIEIYLDSPLEAFVLSETSEAILDQATKRVILEDFTVQNRAYPKDLLVRGYSQINSNHPLIRDEKIEKFNAVIRRLGETYRNNSESTMLDYIDTLTEQAHDILVYGRLCAEDEETAFEKYYLNVVREPLCKR